MCVPSQFLVKYDSEEFVFHDDWDCHLLYTDGFSHYWMGGWAACWVFLSLSGQAHDAEFFEGEVTLVCSVSGERTSISLHHFFDFVVSDL